MTIETSEFPGQPKLGIRRKFHFDHATNQFTIETIQDLALDANKRRFNSFDERAPWKDINHVMSIPLSIYYELKRQGVFDDDKRFREFVNDPNFAKMRTRPGRI